jgi:hypothetical protein
MSNPNNDAHRTAVAVAEGARQTSKAANNTAAGHLAADRAFYTAVLASGRANGIITGAYRALVALGVDPGNSPGGDV